MYKEISTGIILDALLGSILTRTGIVYGIEWYGGYSMVHKSGLNKPADWLGGNTEAAANLDLNFILASRLLPITV